MKSQVSITPQAPSFFGVVDIPKTEIADELEQRYLEARSKIPKSERKGFRSVVLGREEAEAQLGPTALYGNYWRDVFIEHLQSKVAEVRKSVCYVDAVNVVDRSVHWELNGIFYLAPEVSFHPKLVDGLKTDALNFFRDQFVNEAQLKRRLARLQEVHSTMTLAPDAPIRAGDLVQVEVDSDVNKRFQGTPQKAVWELMPERLPGEIIDALLGRQVGQIVIVPLPKPVDGGPSATPARMTIKILEHKSVERKTLKEVAELEGVRDEEILRDRERRSMETEFEKNKVGTLFHFLSQNVQMGPIPAPFVYDLAQMRVGVLRDELGEKEFSRRYGRDQEALQNQFLSIAERESRELFESWGVCRDLGLLPDTNAVRHFCECSKMEISGDTEIQVLFLLCKEKVLEVVCGIQPPTRSTLVLPDRNIVPGSAGKRGLKPVR